MSPQDPFGLAPLADRYEIIAELRERENANAYMARRRSDGAGVVIVVTRTPEGDEKNALTYFAADANLLATLTHRNLIPVLESCWIGADAIAVVHERVAGDTLAEMLARAEELSPPRIAAILGEVNALLEWARAQQVTQRGLAPDSIFLEPGSDRVLASFVARPIPFTGAPGAEGDARTVATLAWMMLARSPEPPNPDAEPLAELRPDLPERLVERTKELLRLSRESSAVPDVREYVALVAMMQAMKSAEEETARVGAELSEEQYRTREQLDLERQQLDRRTSEEAQRLAGERAALERQIADERAELVRREEHERAELARQRAELLAERAELDRAAAAAREEIAVERQRLAEERTAAEQSIAAVAARLGAEERELQGLRAAAGERITADEQIAAGEPETADGRFAAAGAAAGAAAAAAADEAAAAEPVATPAVPVPELVSAQIEPAPREPTASDPLTPVSVLTPVASGRWSWLGDRRHLVPGAAVAFSGIMVAAALAIAAHQSAAGRGSAIVPPSMASARDTSGVVVDSAAGRIAPAPAAVQQRGGSAAADSAHVAAAVQRPAADTAKPAATPASPDSASPSPAARSRATLARRRPPEATPDSTTRDSTTGRRALSDRMNTLVPDAGVRLDSIRGLDSSTLRVRAPVPGRSTHPAVRPDTAASRRDSLLRRDTVPRPDTSGSAPDSAARPF